MTWISGGVSPCGAEVRHFGKAAVVLHSNSALSCLVNKPSHQPKAGDVQLPSGSYAVQMLISVLKPSTVIKFVIKKRLYQLVMILNIY